MQIARALEKKVHEVLEASILLAQQGDRQAGTAAEPAAQYSSSILLCLLCSAEQCLNTQSGRTNTCPSCSDGQPTVVSQPHPAL